MPTISVKPLLLLSVLPLAIWSKGARAESGLSYNRDIRPILSDNCFACHGPDDKERKAKLRLDRHEDAFKPAKSGDYAIVPGDPKKSTLIERIMTDDEDDVMPPPKSGKKLTARQKAILDLTAKSATYATHAADPMYYDLYVSNKWIEPIENFLGDAKLTDAAWYKADDIIPAWRGANSVGGGGGCDSDAWTHDSKSTPSSSSVFPSESSSAPSAPAHFAQSWRSAPLNTITRKSFTIGGVQAHSSRRSSAARTSRRSPVPAA